MPDKIEKLVCPRRNEGYIPEFVGDNDTWETNTWDMKGKNDYWPYGFDKPRTCSFCGGVNIDDAIKLIEEGWEIHTTTKPYKWYLEPPGTIAYRRRVINAMGDEEKVKIVFGEPIKSAVPPVKMYGQHATKEQITKLNLLYDIYNGKN